MYLSPCALDEAAPVVGNAEELYHAFATVDNDLASDFSRGRREYERAGKPSAEHRTAQGIFGL